MKHIKVLAAAMIAVVLTSSCVIRFDKKKILEEVSRHKGATLKASGVYVTKDTVVAPFTSLVMAPGYSDMEFVQDTCTYVTVYGSDNVIPLLSILSENGRLSVGCDFNSSGYDRVVGDADVKFTVHAPSLDSIKIENVGDFVCRRLDVADRNLTITGNGRADLDFGEVTASTLTVECHGASSVEFDSVRTSGSSWVLASGRSDVELGKLMASSLSVDCSGTTSVSAYYVETGSCSLDVTGNSSVELETVCVDRILAGVSGRSDVDLDNVDVKDFDVTVSGSGSVSLAGKAVKAAYAVSGSSEVNAEDLRCGNTATTVSGRGSVKYLDADGKVVKKTK